MTELEYADEVVYALQEYGLEFNRLRNNNQPIPDQMFNNLLEFSLKIADAYRDSVKHHEEFVCGMGKILGVKSK